MLGSRAFSGEAAAAFGAYERDPSEGTRFLLIRNIRKLLRRFDPDIWALEEKKAAAAFKTVQQVNEWLTVLSPGRPLPDKKFMAAQKEKILKAVNTLEGQVPSAVPIHQVRSVHQWAQQTSPGTAKIVIIENAERMQDSARNALLKLLEEPPPHFYLILLTTRRSLIIPTVLSRVRPYVFAERNRKTAAEVLERIYRDDSSAYDTLWDYFYRYMDVDLEEISAHARQFLDAALAGETAFPFDLSKRGRMSKARLELWLRALLRDLAGRLRQTVEKRDVPLRVLEDWTEQIRQALVGAEYFNQNPALLLEQLYYRFRDAE
jgi:DNA polymerase-3 subunit gamma/tau